MIALALLLAATAGTAEAPAPPQTTTVVAGRHYAAGPVHRLVLGDGYRDLWTTPVEVELLDLRGWVPTRRVGGQQTKGLAFQGPDGRSYTFRSVDKDPSEILPADLHGTVADWIVQDQMAASHPGGALVASAITRAAGVLTTHPRLVVLPDDPALGEFRAAFAGLLGTFEEYPQPGYAGATEILDHVEMWRRMQASAADRVDAAALLRARLVDVLVGDWDRHRRQWRWARIPGHAEWQPIAEDRDQAFARYEGLLLDAGRRAQPRFVEFGDHYARIEGQTWNGWEVDRQLLTSLPRGEWEAAARELQGRITDQVLEDAVRALPDAWRRQDGPRLLKALRQRRDHLDREALRFYEHLAAEVDVLATDGPDEVEVDATTPGTVRVAVREAGSPSPYWSRDLLASETKEVRLYLRGGDDRVTLRGDPSLSVRAIGGPGADVFLGPGLRASDHEEVAQAGPGTSLDRRPYEAPPGPPRAPWIPPRDWGRRTMPLLWLSGGPDVGVFVGAGLVTQGYGFRKHPWSDEQVLRAGYAVGAETFRAEYRGQFRFRGGEILRLGARASGIDVLRFYGFGNDSVEEGSDAFHRVRQRQVEIAPDLVSPRGRRLTTYFGARLQHTSTREDPDRVLGRTELYGEGDLWQAGAAAGASFDSRDRPVHPTRGVLLRLDARVFPGVLDLDESFSSYRGSAAFWLSAGRGAHAPTLALRVGGHEVRGAFPFYEAAFLGGPDTVRGLRPQRYAGDRAYWGGAELRQPLGRATLLVPGELGVLVFADAGRVELAGLDDDRWHSGLGGGLWFAVLGRQNTVSLSVARAEGHLAVYGGFGFAF